MPLLFRAAFVFKGRNRNSADLIAYAKIYYAEKEITYIINTFHLNNYNPNSISSGSLSSNNIFTGFSNISFTLTRKPTDSLPSMIRWS